MEQLSQVEILGAGSGLHWEALDADLSIPGLLAGLFETKAYLAQQAGRAASPAKAAAARANGTKGGRPGRAARLLAPARIRRYLPVNRRNGRPRWLILAGSLTV